ncbi:MAG: tol-pal system-associated acyl-CoA thioesterase [Zetaproteobacteria bacterium CG_4_9_14_3_um_filter_49_83]|nr:MAG: tol-pal system-associated acyl-CoA thioesterase [Zetaproteobacteria bacterium CG17_big_fil_post_rev_8_21_14_2_50_50_13]PIY56864.1 MAG: tol-pal system-associated acyl-CoA thioesterase [Zetaproteobacteria bacterium CG_4_10_14_0_8_um_filter_49_80]PJA35151.1 MAG: tol-pal system-associated acyl-CoA thioesterase [Zetaproteobacteria bacterium CG_4_9_14_3_um_filter_49_83]
MPAHQFPVRVYYEDTDHGGVVYHANYLKFMERARTEFMRSRGVELDQCEAQFDVIFAVTTAHVHFIKPARFNELLTVHTSIKKCAGARIYFEQRISRQHADEPPCELIHADITVASISRHGAVRRIPQQLQQCLTT